MRRGPALALLLLLAGLSPARAAPPEAGAATETIVLLRHGEKPAAGLGQLDCQGLNRALALPAVLRQRFGRPAAIFAPNPSVPKRDGGESYDYVRPLATIEPAAIAFGLPVQAAIGLGQLDQLRQALTRPAYRGAVVMVAWEHHEIVDLARALLAANGGDPKAVKHWRGDDFDGLYVLRITTGDGPARASFERQRQGLDGQKTECPAAP